MNSLQYIDKTDRSRHIIEMGLRRNGCQLRYLDEDELDLDLVWIAVEENGFSYRHVPEQYKSKDLLRAAIKSTQGIIISEYMGKVALDQDLQLELIDYGVGFLFHIYNPTQATFDKAFRINNREVMMGFTRYNHLRDERIGKLLTHDHIISYFRTNTFQHVGNAWSENLHNFTNNITVELLVGILKVSPRNEIHMMHYEGFAQALRTVKIDSLTHVK